MCPELSILYGKIPNNRAAVEQKKHHIPVSVRTSVFLCNWRFFYDSHLLR